MSDFVQASQANGRTACADDMDAREFERRLAPPKDPFLVLVKSHLKMSHIDNDDSLLEFYIRAGIDAAAKYTGKLLSRRHVEQSAHIERAPFCIPADHTPTGKIKAYAEVCGCWSEVPVQCMSGMFWFDLTADCCFCGGHVKVEYCAGMDPEEWVCNGEYAQVVNGILRYVTHAYENRGDGDYSSWVKHSGALQDWAACRSICA